MTLTTNLVTDPPATTRVDISLPQGRAYRERIARFVDSAGDALDITTWQIALDIRQEHDSEVIVACTKPNGRIEVNAVLGHVVLNLSAEDVAIFGVGRFRYDLRVLRNQYANLWYPLTGYFTVTPQITR